MNTIAVSHDEAQPDILSGLTQGERYRYFKGRSGQRYIFTKMSASDLADCRQAVVVLLTKNKTEPQEPFKAAPVWLGEIDGDGKRRGPRLGKRKLASSDIYVHLLAENAEKRRLILNDLSPATQAA